MTKQCIFKSDSQDKNVPNNYLYERSLLEQCKYNSLQQNIINSCCCYKQIKNANPTGSSTCVSNVFKSLSDSDLLRSLSSKKIILKNGSDYRFAAKCKRKQKIISKDIGVNTDVCTSHSEYIFDKCVSVLTEHLSKIYNLCDKKKDLGVIINEQDNNYNKKRIKERITYGQNINKYSNAVSYTHLDVYKRQHVCCKIVSWRLQLVLFVIFFMENF